MKSLVTNHREIWRDEVLYDHAGAREASSEVRICPSLSW